LALATQLLAVGDRHLTYCTWHLHSALTPGTPCSAHSAQHLHSRATVRVHALAPASDLHLRLAVEVAFRARPRTFLPPPPPLVPIIPPLKPLAHHFPNPTDKFTGNSRPTPSFFFRQDYCTLACQRLRHSASLRSPKSHHSSLVVSTPTSPNFHHFPQPPNNASHCDSSFIVSRLHALLAA
jgi:hypothetical protein